MSELIHCIKEYSEYLKSDEPLYHKVWLGFAILFYGVGEQVIKVVLIGAVLSKITAI